MLLTPEDLDARGLDGWALGWADSVRFGELDNIGHVNHANYFTWFEALRMRHVVHAGLTRYAPGDPGFVVAAVSANYRAEMRLHDEYVVTTRCARAGRTSFVMEYGVFRDSAETANGTATTVMLVDGRPAPLTDAHRKVLGVP